jgi:hypothetical protein
LILKGNVRLLLMHCSLALKGISVQLVWRAYDLSVCSQVTANQRFFFLSFFKILRLIFYLGDFLKPDLK